MNSSSTGSLNCCHHSLRFVILPLCGCTDGIGSIHFVGAAIGLNALTGEVVQLVKLNKPKINRLSKARGIACGIDSDVNLFMLLPPKSFALPSI